MKVALPALISVGVTRALGATVAPLSFEYLKPTFAPYMKFAVWRSGPFGQLVTVGRDAWTRIRSSLDG
jgi:hypothetical protein